MTKILLRLKHLIKKNKFQKSYKDVKSAASALEVHNKEENI